MTTEEFLQLPDDGIDRELIHGELRERPMTRRNRRHSRTTSKLAKLLCIWLDTQPSPLGEILTGDAAFRLRHDPDTTVGIDVAYLSAELAAETPDAAFIVDGPPILAVEILSPSDKHEDIVEKIELYLSSGVQVVWIVDPDLRTVSVYEPGTEPVLFNTRQELNGDPHMPGLRIPVASLFTQ